MTHLTIELVSILLFMGVSLICLMKGYNYYLSLTLIILATIISVNSLFIAMYFVSSLYLFLMLMHIYDIFNRATNKWNMYEFWH